MSIDTHNQEAVLIAPHFFHYDTSIEEEMKKHFKKVHRILDRPFKSTLLQIASRYAPRIVARFLKPYYSGTLRSLDEKISYILIINGQTLPESIVKELAQKNPDCKIVLYMWDSFKNRRNSRTLLKHTHRSYTFDNIDAQQYKISLLPLFCMGVSQAPSSYKYDLCFIGTLHTDRHVVLEKLLANLDQGARCFIYLYVKKQWIFQMMKLFKPSLRRIAPESVRFTPLPSQEAERILSESKAVLDVEHPNQRGLTIRTIECIGKSKRIITTNKNIARYDFYDPLLIAIIDRERPTIDPEFIRQEKGHFKPEKLKQLSLENWIRTLVTQ